jgi:hypothetical protein
LCRQNRRDKNPVKKAPLTTTKRRGHRGKGLVKKYEFAQESSQSMFSRRQKAKQRLILASKFFWPWTWVAPLISPARIFSKVPNLAPGKKMAENLLP